MRFLTHFAKRLPARPYQDGLSRPHLGALAALGLVAFGLGACANPRTEDALVTGSTDLDGYRTRHPIVLAESAETLDIPVGGQSAVLTARMAHTVTVFAQDARRHGANGITILLPSGSANEVAARRLTQQVAGALAEGGFARSAISRTRYQVGDATADAPVRIAYSRVKAMVMHRCGVWPDPIGGGNPQNNDDWELGCASQTNLAAMVVNPEDLVTPTGEDPVDGTRRTNIITKYRAGTQTKADTGAKGAAIADSVQGGGN
jgi:pilus assembly protein CpaD